ncbi:MAG: hypothetical protein JJU45_03235 [Acidimicrobiia bacterium]|nr:hypothetical protein [Acidimicrobiia bacterium]
MTGTGIAETLVVPARCCGPSTSGNGGWTSGAVAEFVPGRPAQVSLRIPPPLDTPLEVYVDGDEVRVLAADGTLVADGRPGRFDHPAPAAVPLEVALAAESHYPGLIDHAFPRCFTCGPQRSPGDGLRVFPGPVANELSPMAAVVRAGTLPDAIDGALPEPVVWAALDCPSGWPSIAAADGPMVLARMTAEQFEPVPAADLVVVGAELWSDGRKHAGASALYTPDGELVARAESLWIELRS